MWISAAHVPYWNGNALRMIILHPGFSNDGTQVLFHQVHLWQSVFETNLARGEHLIIILSFSGSEIVEVMTFVCLINMHTINIFERYKCIL